MTALTAILAAGALQSAAPDPVLEAFRAACVPHRDDYAAAELFLEQEGWARVADDHTPELARLMAIGREAMADPELKAEYQMSAWHGARADRPYHIVLSRFDAVISEEEDRDGDGVIQEWEEKDVWSSISCNFYALDATEPVDREAMNAWVGAESVAWFDVDGMLGGTWNVYEVLPGTAEIHVARFEAGTPAEAKGFSGVAITMSSAPKEDHAQYLLDKERWAAEDAARAAEVEADDDDWMDEPER